MKTETILASATRTRSIKYYGRTRNITVTAKAYHLGRNAHPHFSVTAEIYSPAARNKNPEADCEACGCLHDESLKVWPEITPVIAMHLSNADDGEPMHGEANGFYWLAGALAGETSLGERYHGGSGDSGKSPEECLRIFMNHCRIGKTEAEGIKQTVLNAWRSGRATVSNQPDSEVTDTCREGMAKAGNAAAGAAWKSLCDAMRPRWKTEAENCLALIRSLAGLP